MGGLQFIGGYAWDMQGMFPLKAISGTVVTDADDNGEKSKHDFIEEQISHRGPARSELISKYKRDIKVYKLGIKC